MYSYLVIVRRTTDILLQHMGMGMGMGRIRMGGTTVMIDYDVLHDEVLGMNMFSSCLTSRTWG